MKQNWIIPLILGVVLAYFLSGPGRVGGGSMYTKASGPAPSWVMQDLDGKPVSSTNFQGRVLLVNFWATWCPPCRAEIPDFIEFTRKHDTNRVVILGVSIDEEGATIVKPFATSMKINYPILLASSNVVEQFGGLAGVPTTFLVDTNGNFVSRHLGPFSESDFKKHVEPLLGTP